MKKISFTLFRNQQSSAPLRNHGIFVLACFLIAVAIGCLIVLDPYGTLFLGRQLNIKLFPYTFSLVVFTFLAIILFLLKYFDTYSSRILEKKEFLLIILYIAGYQTSSLQLWIIDLSDIALGTYVLAILIDAFVKEGKKFINTPIHLLNLLLLIFTLLPLINNMMIPSRTQLLFIKIILMFFLTVNSLYSKKLVIKYTKWLIIITTCSAVFGIFQEAVFLTTGIPVVGLIPADDLERMFERGLFRVPALMLSYKVFAAILAITFIITISLLVFPNPLTRGLKKKMYLSLAAFLMFFALLLTAAQDILLGLFIASGFLLLFRKPRYLVHLTIATLLLIIIVCSFFIYSPGKEDRFYHIIKDVPKEESTRIQLDREGIQGFVHGNYKLSGRGRQNRYTANVHNWPAHNAFILIADETGIFGFIIYSAMFVWIIYRLITVNLVIKDPAYLPIMRGLLCGIIIYLIGAQFTASWAEPFLWILFALTESSALILAKNTEKSLSHNPP